MTDYSRQVRRAVIGALRIDTGMTVLIPAASLYPGTVPASRTFPFGRAGGPLASPFRASGLRSSSHRFAYYFYTKPLYATPGDPTSGLLDSAESQAEKMAAAGMMALDGRVLTLESGMKATITWVGTNVLQDPSEASAWYAVVNFLAEVAG